MVHFEAPTLDKLDHVNETTIEHVAHTNPEFKLPPVIKFSFRFGRGEIKEFDSSKSEFQHSEFQFEGLSA